jgi:hypothetical protein
MIRKTSVALALAAGDAMVRPANERVVIWWRARGEVWCR